MTDRGPASAQEPSELPRVLTLRDATMLVVSSVIGVGIFFTPGGVAKLLPSTGWFFAAWVAGGALALAGALANAELGAMFPRAGGNYVYLTRAYHPMAGFLVGWLSFFAIFAGTVATLAVGATLSLAALVKPYELTPFASTAIAVTVIWLASAVNAYATRAGAILNTTTAYLKLAAIVLLVGAGIFALGDRAPAAAFTSAGEASLSSFGVALSPVIFSFLGWNASVYVAGEIESPGKNLPRSLFLGLGICTTVYVLLTGTFVRTLGMANIVGQPTVGFAAGDAIFGQGNKVVAGIMLASVFGCLNANVLVGPRIAFAMARDRLFFSPAARLNASGTPYVAVLVQAAVATVLVVSFKNNLTRVLDYTTFAIVLATIADTTALYVLRRRAPAQPRPYRAAGYPVVPGLYLVANVAIAVSMLVARPTESIASVAVLLGGVPFFAAFLVVARSRASRRT
jgi:APA family basic amino acid/polyamine antiporter